MAGVLPPNYVSEITFENNSVADITATVTFASLVEENFVVPANGASIASRSIQHDTWEAVDPIVRFTVISGLGGVYEENLSGTAVGVESRAYILGDGGSVVRAA